MNQNKTVFYGKDGIPKWMMEQLAMGIMDVFLPVSFIQDTAGISAVFQTGGCRPLHQMKQMSTEEVFQMFCNLIGQMEANERHYLFPDRYVISTETVFYDPLKSRIKMIFVPNEEGLPGKEQLCLLIRDCMNLASEEGRGYLESLAEEICEKDFSYRGILHRCELLQQEVYVCDIP
ncbi:MAG: hypothetical protein IKJ77_03670 [Firmicutes bacterium]|nr:hypothetical protein [Bacillota bacterium]